VKLSRANLLLLLPIAWLLAVTVPHLDQGDFRRDTGRYAAVGLYMWSGGSLLQPYLNPETPYFNKPPLGLWIHGAVLKLFGVSLPVARAPSILAALGVVCLSVLTARRIGTHSEALVSGLVLALSYDFFRRTREISLDFWQLFFLMVAVYLVVSAAKLERKDLLLAAGIPLGLALLCKPLVALGSVPIMVIWLWLLGKSRQWKWLVFGSVPLALLVALPWHLYMWWQFGDRFTHQYFREETINRARGLMTSGPPHYYLKILATNYWPWLLAVAYAAYLWLLSAKPKRNKARDLLLFGAAWVLFTLLLLSLFPGKQVNYALPLYPMLSWIAAAGLCRIPWPPLHQWYRHNFAGAGMAAVLVFLVVSIAPIKFQKPPDKEWTALFNWLDQQPSEPQSIAQQDLESDDICYFYVKRGRWLLNANANPGANAVYTEKPWDLLLTKVSTTQRIADESIVFQSGQLVLRRRLPAGR
jgi:4-amino-4-deoxy-L-arabinose transferase